MQVTEMPKADIKPCPLCGNTKALWVKCWNDHFIDLCDEDYGGCGCNSGMKETEEEAVKSWNTRAGCSCDCMKGK